MDNIDNMSTMMDGNNSKKNNNDDDNQKISYHSDEILRGIPPDISHLFEGVKNNVNVRNRMYV